MTESNWALCWTSAFPWRLDIITAISALCFSIFFCAISTDYSSSGHVPRRSPGQRTSLFHGHSYLHCVEFIEGFFSFLFFLFFFSSSLGLILSCVTKKILITVTDQGEGVAIDDLPQEGEHVSFVLVVSGQGLR